MNKEKYDQLASDGYCRFPQTLSLEMIDRLRDATDRLLDAQSMEERTRVRAQGSMMPITADPIFAELVTLPAARNAFADLGFPAPTFTDGYIISKPGGSPRLFWHYDWFAWEDNRSYELPAPQLFCMYYLSDTRPENGCLRVIPGSHIHHHSLHDLMDAPHSETLGQASDPQRIEFSDQPDEVDVPVQAGDLLIGDARVLHAAHRNDTDERRTLITLWYQPDFASLPERMQAQMAAKAQSIPGEWPEEAQSRLRSIMATYTGTAAAYPRTLYRRRSPVPAGSLAHSE
ncbi:hypothetical protein CCAX7_15920 [Capsulimonas corticalis]|uniref:Uncharacterized protein n=1 Tax=Capsulimonas corticalis TaxID=2219043 RepID=A0A402CZ43_9BACT|nr:phytanoyl-CoA dioxygenase family protein [Capsulimonas corticalis]BDI29541.1 hypothetical protein CCAX7_15920 [Capsulimonas corticalis]